MFELLARCDLSFLQVGGDGAGHFVKMVHNGIEYGDMQVYNKENSFVLRNLYDILIYRKQSVPD